MVKKGEDYNGYMKEYVRKRYIKLKIDAIEYKGGKCKICGYDKCPAALVFHHRNPDEKEFDWSHLRKRSWDTIKLELDKCDMLCCRCHAETHYDEGLVQNALEWLKRKSERFDKIKGTKGVCKQCGEEFTLKKGDRRTRKYCSKKCTHKSQEITNWPDDAKLIKQVDDIGRVQVGKLLGVSDRAVAKRYKKAQI